MDEQTMRRIVREEIDTAMDRREREAAKRREAQTRELIALATRRSAEAQTDGRQG